VSKSKGLGDTIAKITSITKLNIIAENIAKIITKNGDCNCESHRDKLNKMFPYKKWGKWKIPLLTSG